MNVVVPSCRRRKLVLSAIVLMDGMFVIIERLGGGEGDVHVHQLNEGSTDKVPDT